MKLTLLKAAAVASALVFNTAYADSIQVDLNGDSALSVAFEQFTVNYDSHTLVDLNNNTVRTYAGYDLIGNNMNGIATGPIYTDFTDMVGGLSGGANTLASAGNFYDLFNESSAAGSYITFGVDLIGTLNPTTGITYTSGTLNLWQGFTNGNPAEQILTANFATGGVTAGNQDVLSLSGPGDILKDDVMFFSQNGTPISFEDYLLAYPLADIRLLIDQNVQGGASSLLAAIGGDVAAGFKGTDGAGNVYVSANHSASLNINVPEPTTLAILGLGLLGMAGASRRKAK